MPQINRSAGVLLHPSSLPGNHAIGEIGPEAYRWLDLLAECEQKVWQVLPLGPTGYGNSPYQSPSTFAGNPLLISLDLLVEDGLLESEELREIPPLDPSHVDFGAAVWHRPPLLKRAADRFQARTSNAEEDEQFRIFCEKEAHWLDDYALFAAIKADQEMRPWWLWPEGLAQRDSEPLTEAAERLSDSIEEIKVTQFFFDRQWLALRKYAAGLGIQIVGDVPIFVAHDSADVWAGRELFHLDAEGNPTVVAGVPPDYFSATGQLWGNPLYDWNYHRATDYEWWIRRMQKALQWVDLIRIDHFRGFAAYWEVPADEDTAMNGKWVDGPRAELFQAFTQTFGKNLPIIAEDLGVITDDVVELRDQFELPGMRVLQFAFGADSLAEEYIPENYPPNSVAYTGTHDNDTTMGLFQSEAGDGGSTRTQEQVDAERRTILNYTKTDGSELNWDYIRAISHSNSNLAIYPLQDVIGLGSEARMNTPGIPEGNWGWRFTWDMITPRLQGKLRGVTRTSNRA